MTEFQDKIVFPAVFLLIMLSIALTTIYLPEITLATIIIGIVIIPLCHVVYCQYRLLRSLLKKRSAIITTKSMQYKKSFKRSCIFLVCTWLLLRISGDDAVCGFVERYIVNCHLETIDGYDTITYIYYSGSSVCDFILNKFIAIFHVIAIVNGVLIYLNHRIIRKIERLQTELPK